jgi:O-antigen/teichoic acid export membrane protein
MRRLWTNTLWKTAAIAGSKLLMFGLLLAASRRLSLDDFGHLNFALVLAMLLWPVVDAGVSTALWREAAVAGDGGRGAYRSALGLRLFTVVLGLLAAATVLRWFALPDAAMALIALALVGTAVDALTNLRQAIFKANERLREDAWCLLANRGTFVIVGLLMLWFGGGLIGLGVALLLGQAAGYLVSRHFVLFAESAADVSPTPRELLRQSLPLAFVGLFTALYFRVDMLMLQKMIGAEATGLYSAAYRLIEAAMILPAAFLPAYFPRLARAAADGTLPERTEPALSLLGHLATAGVAWGIVFAPEILTTFYGSPFAPAATALRLLLGALWLIYPNYLLTHLLIAGGRQNRYAWIVIACAAANVLLNLTLIPWWRINGAALATGLTEAVLLAASWRTLRASLGATALQKLVVPLHYGAVYLAVFFAAKSAFPMLAWVLGTGVSVGWATTHGWLFHRRAQE